ncbi:hypothetical protein EC988_003558 [Linderina pennispora]|nr:hypothetical protein EC988_003558 [Linderina pennispora]
MLADDSHSFTIWNGGSAPRPYNEGGVYAIKIELLNRVMFGVLHLHESGTSVVWRLGESRWPLMPYVSYEALDTFLNDPGLSYVRAVHAGQFSEQQMDEA